MVARFRERVLAALGDPVERIVLFGSRGRGDEHAESDWDFAVFLDQDPSEREQRLLSHVTGAVESELDVQIQSIARSGAALARDGRAVLQHPRSRPGGVRARGDPDHRAPGPATRTHGHGQGRALRSAVTGDA